MNDLHEAIDTLGALRAEIKALQDQAKVLESAIKESGEWEVEGQMFRGVVVDQERTNVDWKAVAAKLNPSRQLVQAHTTKKHVVSLRVSAHVKAAA